MCLGRRRAAEDAAGDGESEFQLAAAAAAALAFPAYLRNAELNIQVHGGIGFTWEHDAHLHLRRALTVNGILGGDGPAADVFDLTGRGIARANSLDLPPEAEALRGEIRAEAQRIAELDAEAQLDEPSRPATSCRTGPRRGDVRRGGRTTSDR